MKFLLSITLLSFWINSHTYATDLPKRVDIDYTLSGVIGQGKAHETLLRQDKNGTQHYTIDSEIKASGFLKLFKQGSILRHSEGIITSDKGMQPLYFSDQRSGKPVRTVKFDWEAARLVYHRKGREIIENLPQGTLDELSLAYHFVFTDLPKQQAITVHETDYRIQHTVRYAVTYETLDTPLGKLDTIVLTKQQEPDDMFKKKIWLATEHFMLPVRIISTEKNGMDVDQIVKKITYELPDNSTQ